ncbi:MAG: TetR/AcrR family transcriptional regulator [Pseudoxanthomonas sp.]
MDARQRKTREALFNALEALLEEADYADITVSKLARRADVGRPTFYRHFESVDAMLEEQLRDGLDEQLTLSRANVPNLQAHSWMELAATHAFSRAQDRPRLFQLALAGAAGNRALQLFQAQIETLMDEVAACPGFVEVDSRTRPHQSAFYAGAIFGMLKDWLDKGMPQTPEEMGVIFASLTNLPR